MPRRRTSAVFTRQLEEEVQLITRDVSSKFVIEPSIDEIRSDLLIALKRHCHSVCIRAHQSQHEDPTKPTISPTSETDGLGTNLRPTNGWTPDDNIPTGGVVEAYLHKVQFELLSHLDKMAENDTRKTNNITNSINSLFSKLKKREDLVVVPTDKTNSFVLLQTSEYANRVNQHLADDAVKTTTDCLSKAKETAKQKLDSFADLLSTNEYNYIKATINKCSVPTVQLLIKDHKPKKAGRHPSRLVVPAKNFTAAFPHVGQRGIKKILDRNNINYSKKTIIQASHLKEELEKLPIRKSTNTIFSIDAEKMYPSVKFIQIEKAVNYFL